MTSSDHSTFSTAELRQAWERREFLLHYQPLVDLRTGSITGAEALLRWRYPTHGLLPPGRFVSLAESSGSDKTQTDPTCPRSNLEVGVNA